jgi:hypothetical protein
MRILALARYRLLRTIRSASPIFALAFVAAAVPVAGAGHAFQPSFGAWEEMESFLSTTALAVTWSYGLHLLVLLAAAGVLATRRRSPEGHELLDLTETVPATSWDRFLGDAAGILAALLCIHACVLPILGLAVVLSPLPAATFFWLELVVLAVAVFVSAGAAANLHAVTKWRQTQLARSFATFIVLAIMILRFTTRGQAFADAAWFSFLVRPSPPTWNALMATVPNPAVLFACMLLLYAGFLAWYAVQSVRHLEQR